MHDLDTLLERLAADATRDPAKVTPPLTPASVPGAFHVTLDGPAPVREFHLVLCGSPKTGECAGGLVVFDHPASGTAQPGTGAGSVRVRP